MASSAQPIKTTLDFVEVNQLKSNQKLPRAILGTSTWEFRQGNEREVLKIVLS
jgi:hypothetical protein